MYDHNDVKGTSLVDMLDLNRNLIHKLLHRLNLLRSHTCDDLELFVRITGNNSGGNRGIDSFQMIGIRNNDRFYIFDDASACLNGHAIRKFAECTAGNSTCISQGNRFGATHCRNQFLFQDLDVCVITRI